MEDCAFPGSLDEALILRQEDIENPTFMSCPQGESFIGEEYDS